jgi:hypothetical protein
MNEKAGRQGIRRILDRGVLLLAAYVAMGSSPLPGWAAEPFLTNGSISFADHGARRRFEDYIAFLERDPVKFAHELATLRVLTRSEVRYHVKIGEVSRKGVEGNLSTDGARIYITISASGGSDGETASVNSRFAHEFEHARQFEAGELAFVRNPETGSWRADILSYDIGDEVKAWAAQLKAAVSTDFWVKQEGDRRPSTMHKFAQAATDEKRARVLAKCGYGSRNLRLNCNVVFSSETGYKAGQFVRPSGQLNFFGRVHSSSSSSNLISERLP